MWMKILVGAPLPEATIGAIGFHKRELWVSLDASIEVACRRPAPTMKGPSAYTARWSSSFFFTLWHICTLVSFILWPFLLLQFKLCSTFNPPNQTKESSPGRMSQGSDLALENKSFSFSCVNGPAACQWDRS